MLANNSILSESEANLTPFLLNASFVTKYTVWFGFGSIPLLEENLTEIELELNALGHQLPPLFKNRRELFRLTKRMLNKNRFYRTGLINFQFFFNAKNTDSLITAKAFSRSDFHMNSQGLLAHLSELNEYSESPFHKSRPAKAIFWEQVGSESKSTESSAIIILNEKQVVCEGIDANLFMVKENALFTPSTKSGCYSDILRPVIIQLAKELNMNVIEPDDIEVKHLQKMDEVFFASEAQGIQWILGFENRRYVHECTDRIFAALNYYLKKNVKEME
ncbi:MAG TPA: aminotransferase class IV [Draconibacterium sp.]|nr:aminotransferase class IV [Draconibacterium sp.]